MISSTARTLILHGSKILDWSGMSGKMKCQIEGEPCIIVYMLRNFRLGSLINHIINAVVFLCYLPGGSEGLSSCHGVQGDV